MSNYEMHGMYNPETPDATTIAESLERYYETHEGKLRYEVLRSIAVEGHEVAWMKHWIPEGDEKRFVGRELECACTFVEDVGWKEENGKITALTDDQNCEFKKKAELFRIYELRVELQARGLLVTQYENQESQIEGIILDLMERGRAGEWLKGANPAHFWGGYFYLQLVEDITGFSWDNIHAATRSLYKQKKIDLEGMVVQEYSEPPEPKWELAVGFEVDGWKGSAMIPTHSKMPQVWYFEVTRPNGQLLKIRNPYKRLMYSPDFGIDEEDIETAREYLTRLVDKGKILYGTPDIA
jgi:hypothetical protein